MLDAGFHEWGADGREAVLRVKGFEMRLGVHLEAAKSVLAGDAQQELDDFVTQATAADARNECDALQLGPAVDIAQARRRDGFAAGSESDDVNRAGIQAVEFFPKRAPLFAHEHDAPYTVCGEQIVVALRDSENSAPAFRLHLVADGTGQEPNETNRGRQESAA